MPCSGCKHERVSPTLLSYILIILQFKSGDFAVLLKTGMKIKQALFFNVVSSVLCLFGMLVGIGVGNVESASSWIFAFTAGTFVYIALVDMVNIILKKSNSRSFNWRKAIGNHTPIAWVECSRALEPGFYRRGCWQPGSNYLEWRIMLRVDQLSTTQTTWVWHAAGVVEIPSAN